jgi:hypothetical protein
VRTARIDPFKRNASNQELLIHFQRTLKLHFVQGVDRIMRYLQVHPNLDELYS